MVNNILWKQNHVFLVGFNRRTSIISWFSFMRLNKNIWFLNAYPKAMNAMLYISTCMRKNKRKKNVNTSAEWASTHAQTRGHNINESTTHSLRGLRYGVRGTCAAQIWAGNRLAPQLDFRTSNGRACVGWIANNTSSFFSFRLLAVFVYYLPAHFP